MRTVLQRVTSASVRWDSGEASIGPGYCLLVGVADTDEDRDAEYLADKLLKLRVFSDEAGKFNLSATQVNAAFLVVSQFTLFADARGQSRPSFLHAARPEQAIGFRDAFPGIDVGIHPQVGGVAQRGVRIQHAIDDQIILLIGGAEEVAGIVDR